MPKTYYFQRFHASPALDSICRQRVKLILALIPEWETDKFDKDEITKAIEKLSKLSATRNHWVHGV
jgi:hypothetical protein